MSRRVRMVDLILRARCSALGTVLEGGIAGSKSKFTPASAKKGVSFLEEFVNNKR
jgi:hypothetical protein